MNIYYFDPSLDCSLFFISPYRPSPHYSLSVLDISVLTLYPLTHFLILLCTFIFPSHLNFSLSFWQAHLPSSWLFSSFDLSSFHSPSLSSLSPPPSPSAVKSSHTPSKLELSCLYSERSQVQKATWKYQIQSRQLRQTSRLGCITTTLQKPITSAMAGNYTCVLQLKNGQTVSAVETVALPHKGGMHYLVCETTHLCLALCINIITRDGVWMLAPGKALQCSRDNITRFICQRACGL